MSSIRKVLENELKKAFDMFKQGHNPQLRGSKHADFQVNGAISLAKFMGKEPKAIAKNIIESASINSLCQDIIIAESGFINLTLSTAIIEKQLIEMANSDDLLVDKPDEKRVIIDYSSPNIAKAMHVGHLRSTIIGDALAKILEFLGQNVLRQNHVGDWGTPFGMLIEYIFQNPKIKVEDLEISEFNQLYKLAREQFDADDNFKKKARRRVVSLQAGDKETVETWRKLISISLNYFQKIYKLLNISLSSEDVKGESAYERLIPLIAKDLEDKGLLIVDQGAKCVFLKESGFEAPLIVQKNDGAYTYGATDLAALYDRLVNLEADLILYVVGAPQSAHLNMCFEIARLAGWGKSTSKMIHVAFGSVLGPDMKMLKSRTGEAALLEDLVSIGFEKAKEEILKRRGTELSDEEIARQIAIAALKYGDLSGERTKDYVFNVDKLVSFEGKTGPYLLYACARISSILQKASYEIPLEFKFKLDTSLERRLGLVISDFEYHVLRSFETFEPHILCAYLYELATVFSQFYETHPVIKVNEEIRAKRLALCFLTRKVLTTGLGLLGIQVPERM